MSVNVHIIRLRGPWQLQALERYVPRSSGGYGLQVESVLPRGRGQMPADWCETMGHDFLGVVRYSRNFNRPTNLEPHERVWLVVEPPRSCGRVSVNDVELGYVRFGAPAGRFDISALLKDHNAVVIDVEHPEFDDQGHALDEGSVFIAGGLVGEVRLEIEEVI